MSVATSDLRDGQDTQISNVPLHHSNPPVSASSTPPATIDYDNISFSQLNALLFFSLMPVAGVAVRTMVYPLTLLKTRMQTDAMPVTANHAQLGIVGALRQIVQKEGWSGLFRGIRSNLLVLLVSPVYITTLELTRDFLNNVVDKKKQTQLPQTSSIWLNYASPAVPFASGAFASMIAQLLGVPLDVISQRQMIQTGKKISADVVLKDLIAKEGVRALWRGYFVSAMSQVPYAGCLWGVYQHAKLTLRAKFTLPLTPEQRQGKTRWTNFSRELIIVPISAGMGASIAAIASNPLDVLRTRLQTHNVQLHGKPTLPKVWKLLIAERGYAGFFAGIQARTLGAIPSSALMMTFYEVVKRVCLVENDDNPS